MINTECGEMIEPRVGDVVRDLISRSIGRVTKDGFQFGPHHLFEFGGCPCILLHRPFQVGDVIQKRLGPRLDKDEGWHYCTGSMLSSKYQVSSIEQDPHLFQHKNPAWRDHSEYKQEKTNDE